MVLNALAIDPKRAWKGPWRWFSEELLDCCSPLEVVGKKGITIAEFVCLARCNGAQALPSFATSGDVELFREQVIEHMSKNDQFLVVSYDRQTLGQTGSGHFSPIGGYHKEKDMVLLLDVARFKYPPHWVALPLLFAAMQTIDPSSLKSRGFISLMAAPVRPHIFSRIRAGSEMWSDFVDCICNQLPSLFLPKDQPCVVELGEFVAKTAAFAATMSCDKPFCTANEFFSSYEQDLSDRLADEHRRMIDELFEEIHSTSIFRQLAQIVPSISRSNEGQATGQLSCKAARKAISAELLTIIVFFLLRILPNTPQVDKAERKNIRFGQTVADAERQLARLTRIQGEVGYLWSSFDNIVNYCCGCKRTDSSGSARTCH